MAKAKEIYVSVAFTKNLGNYQSIRFDSGLTLTLEENEKVDDIYKLAWDKVGDQIEKQLALFEDEKKSGTKKGL